jgi:hypothetical protein
MTGLRKWFAIPLLAALSWFALPGQARAATTTLSDHNSTIGLNLSSPAGMTSWTVDSVNQVNQQWFWFRVGASGAQSDLSHITTTPTVTPFGTKNVTALYANSSYGVQLSWTLNGQNNGSGKSGLNQVATIYNYSTTSPLDFHFFMYSDFSLQDGTQAGHQYVNLGNDGNGDSTAVQTLGNFGVATNDFVVMTAASRLETAPYNQTLTELNTVNGLALNNNLSSGPDHPTWALEWDLTIAANGSAQLGMLDHLQVPEPSTAALLLVGLGIVCLRRQRQAR